MWLFRAGRCLRFLCSSSPELGAVCSSCRPRTAARVLLQLLTSVCQLRVCRWKLRVIVCSAKPWQLQAISHLQLPRRDCWGCIVYEVHFCTLYEDQRCLNAEEKRWSTLGHSPVLSHRALALHRGQEGEILPGASCFLEILLPSAKLAARSGRRLKFQHWKKLSATSKLIRLTLALTFFQ